MIAFGEYLDLSLPGCLGYETIALPGNLQDEGRRVARAAYAALGAQMRKQLFLQHSSRSESPLDSLELKDRPLQDE